jgi:hypothetical protein
VIVSAKQKSLGKRNHGGANSKNSGSLKSRAIGFFDLPGEVRNMIYGYMSGATNALRQTNKRLWTEFSGYAYCHKWFASSSEECFKDYHLGNAFLIESYPPSSYAPSVPMDAAFAKEVTQLFLEDRCLSNVKYERKNPGGLPCFRIAFPKLKKMKCKCPIVSVDWNRKVEGGKDKYPKLKHDSEKACCMCDPYYDLNCYDTS